MVFAYFFAESATAVVSVDVVIVVDESVAIVVVSVVITAVESVVDVSSVLGLFWQAAKVSILPTNNKVNTFFITLKYYFSFRLQISFFY